MKVHTLKSGIAIKDFLRQSFGEQSAFWWGFQQLCVSPLSFPRQLLGSLIATFRLTGKPWPLLVRINHSSPVRIKLHATSKVVLKGILSFEEWGGVEESSSLSMGQDALLLIDGNFSIGPGVHISVSRFGVLRIGGRKDSSGSGITCRTRIMVERSLSVGYDCIIAWGVYITDSDWHNVKGRQRSSPVRIGDHVWIAHDVSVLKDSEIANGCIVAPKSTVTGRHLTQACLLAGSPAKIKREGIEWSR
jgi:acetyltransferase-like isoleucine patch superfamily enzyme